MNYSNLNTTKKVEKTLDDKIKEAAAQLKDKSKKKKSKGVQIL